MAGFFQFGTTIAASVTRAGGTWTSLTAPVTDTEVFATLSLVAPVINGSNLPLLPLGERDMIDPFSVQNVRLMRALAVWPAGQTKNNPIRAGDLLTIGTDTYRIHSATPYAGQYIDLLVEVPLTS